MNDCILQGILKDKTLRFSTDGLPVAKFMIEDQSLKADEPGEPIKAIYFGESGEKAHKALNVGDVLVLNGHLRIIQVSHQMGDATYKDSTATLMVDKIYRIQQNPEVPA